MQLPIGASATMPSKAPLDYQPHWVENLPNEDYRGRKDHLSNSMLQDAVDSLAHFHWYNCLGNPRAESKPLQLGTIVHAAILEHERYANCMIVQPEFNMRTNQGKEDCAAWKKALKPEWIPVTEEQREIVMRILDNVNKHRQLLPMLEASKKEISGFFREPHFGFACKIRPDMIIPGDRLVLDVKSTSDGSRGAFSRSVLNYRYYFQAAFYLMGASQIEAVPFENFFWVAAETKPPYLVEVYPADLGWIGCGDADVIRTLSKIDRAIKTNRWTSYQEEPTPLSPPNWFIQKPEYTTEVMTEFYQA
jgi:exodeoxyribonuclease VIII